LSQLSTKCGSLDASQLYGTIQPVTGIALSYTVQKNNPHKIKELTEEMLAAVNSISEETLAAVVQNFQLQMVIDADGAYTESVYFTVNLPLLLNSKTLNTVMFAV
jgi:hypothetical protein